MDFVRSVGIQRGWVAALALFGGCSRSDFPLAPVSGVVTLDGQPLPEARVGFEPVRKGESLLSGPGAYGITDQRGRYSLETIDGDRGAVIGEHRVWIQTKQMRDNKGGEIQVVSAERLPAKYHTQSNLTMVVPQNGTNQANFELKSK